MKKKVILLLIAVMGLMVFALCGCQSEAVNEEIPAAQQVDYAGIIEDISTVQAFTEEAVSEDDINAIVMAGVNAPSAMNGQPWHFTVVTDQEMLEELAGGMSFGGSPVGGTPPAGFEMPEGMDFPENAPDGMAGNISEQPAGTSAAPTADMAASSGAKAGMGDAPLAIVISCKEGSELDAGLATQNMSAEAQLLGYGTKIISSPKMVLNQSTYLEMLGVPEDMSVVCVLLAGKTDTAEYDVISGATTRNPVDEIVTFVK